MANIQRTSVGVARARQTARLCHSRAGGNPVTSRTFLDPCLRRGDMRRKAILAGDLATEV